MATARNIDVRNYCDSVFEELTDMKARVLGLSASIDQMKDADKGHIKSHLAHFKDIANMLDWKLEILTKACPGDWTKYSAGSERVSVEVRDRFEKEFAPPGDIGG